MNRGFEHTKMSAIYDIALEAFLNNVVSKARLVVDFEFLQCVQGFGYRGEPLPIIQLLNPSDELVGMVCPTLGKYGNVPPVNSIKNMSGTEIQMIYLPVPIYKKAKAVINAIEKKMGSAGYSVNVAEFATTVKNWVNQNNARPRR